MISEFIQMWQNYRVAMDNKDCGEQVMFTPYGQVTTISISKLNELKHSTMLEF